MERDNRLKRARDVIEGDENIRECKKLETGLVEESGDALGVFDFPWLKEGVFMAADDFLEPHIDLFSPCFEIQDAGIEECCMHQDSPLLLLDQDLLDYKFDFDNLDYCFWSSVIDQPLDVNVCINKA